MWSFSLRSVALSTALLAVVLLPTGGGAEPLPIQAVVTIRMAQSSDGTRVYFDPVGIHISPGQKVRWVQESGYHTTTAYHPSDSNHELRIPEGAEPWDSGVLQTQAPDKGSTFEHTFTQEGVYDYFCVPHEAAGMVGRIVVGRPLEGPGTKSFNYAPDKGWKPVPPVAQKEFPSVTSIIEKQVIHKGSSGQ
jgi:plastocyanin